MLEDSRSPVGGEAVHLFSGKVFCADCHSSMIRRKTKSHGKEYVYFICGANKQNKEICSPHRITEQAVYDTVLAVIQSQVSLALDLESALKELDGISWERRELERIERGIADRKKSLSTTRR